MTKAGSLDNKSKYAKGRENFNKHLTTCRSLEIQSAFSNNIIDSHTNKNKVTSPDILFLSSTIMTVMLDDDFISLLTKSNIITGNHRLKTPDYIDFTPEILLVVEEHLKTHDSIFKPEFNFLSSKGAPAPLAIPKLTAQSVEKAEEKTYTQEEVKKILEEERTKHRSEMSEAKAEKQELKQSFDKLNTIQKSILLQLDNEKIAHATTKEQVSNLTKRCNSLENFLGGSDVEFGEYGRYGKYGEYGEYGKFSGKDN